MKNILDRFRAGEATLDFDLAPPEGLPPPVDMVPLDRTSQCQHVDTLADGTRLRCLRRNNHAGRHLAIHPKTRKQQAFGEGVHGRYFRLNYNRGGK